MNDDIKKRLVEMELARTNMQTQLEATSAALDAITTKIDDLKARQDARRESNDRKDHKSGEKAAQTSSSTKEKAAKQLTEQAEAHKSVASAEKRMTLVPGDLTEDDITVKPNIRYDR